MVRNLKFNFLSIVELWHVVSEGRANGIDQQQLVLPHGVSISTISLRLKSKSLSSFISFTPTFTISSPQAKITSLILFLFSRTNAAFVAPYAHSGIAAIFS